MVLAQLDGGLHRNFQGYTTDPSDVLIGFGACAIGRLPQGYAQNESGTRAYQQPMASRSFGHGEGLLLHRG